MIYFLKAGPDGRIKIGTTGNLEGRLATIRNASPYHVEVLGTCEGSRVEEGVLHSRLAPYRVHMEWFEPSPQVLAAVDDAIKNGVELFERFENETSLMNDAKFQLMAALDNAAHSRGISHCKLAREAKVSATIMYRWKRYRACPTLPTIGKLEAALERL